MSAHEQQQHDEARNWAREPAESPIAHAIGIDRADRPAPADGEPGTRSAREVRRPQEVEVCQGSPMTGTTARVRATGVASFALIPARMKETSSV
jgi:hypothetical protein